MEELFWTNEYRKLRELSGWEDNPRKISEEDGDRLEESLVTFGQIHLIAIDCNNVIIDGHQRASIWNASSVFGGDHVVEVRVANRELTEEERQQLTIFLHEGTTGNWNFEMLKGWDKKKELEEWGFKLPHLRLSDKKSAEGKITLGEGEGEENSEQGSAEESEGWSGGMDWGKGKKPKSIECPECGCEFDPWRKND